MHGGRGARRRRLLLLTAATVVAAACGASEAAGPPPPTGTVGGVGQLPEPLTRTDDPPATTTSEPASTPPTTRRERAEAPAGVVGERVDGNRVLLIGDSLLASTSRRYGGQMCAALVPLGWAAEVSAETGRFIDFGMRVLDRRLRPETGLDWDAVVVFLGNNYGSNPDVYREGLQEMVDATAPRPTVLLTVTEFRADRAEVNAVIREVADMNPHVQVLDWATVAAQNPALQGDDGLHLTESGRERLAFEVAAVLGGAPTYPAEGECLGTSFSDDSAGTPVSRSGGTSTGGGSTGGTRTTATTTTAPRAPGATTTTVPRTTVPGTTTPATTVPATTLPATTTAVTPPPATPPPTTTQTTTAATQPADTG